MTLTREQIEKCRKWPNSKWTDTLCDMALASLTMRDEVLEEAAKECDRQAGNDTWERAGRKVAGKCAAEIRALKSNREASCEA